MRAFFIVLILTIATSFSASAALLRAVEGGVLVNTGNGYSRTAYAITVEAGQGVRTTANGSAEIVYDNGCIFAIKPNQTIIVKTAPSCEVATGTIGSTTLLVVGGVAVAGGAAALVLLRPSSP